ncbi:MAG TPA: O-antigen ligase family protein [Patescibacteria group bacterium]|nr:O-antigen ligase family protein [Patescibacteria group bacterium]
MFSKKYIGIFLIVYTLLRVFSYFFSPETPLHAANPVNTVVSGIMLLVIGYWLLARNPLGWYAIALEIILGGAGGYLAAGPLSLRTCLLLISILIYFGQKLRDHKLKELFQQNKTVVYLFSALFLAVGISAIHGFLAGHNKNFIFPDTIPYLFLLYYFPLKELITAKSSNLQIFKSSLLAAILGNFLLIIFTFIGYSSELFVLQDSYYHWYRDVAIGKITELPFHFYRLVINEHLLLVPIILWLLSCVIARRSEERTTTSQSPSSTKKPWDYYVAPLLVMTLLIILSINLTRIYMLALAFGYLFLFSKQHWKRWFVYGVVSCLLFVVSFTSIHLVASRGQSLGWELFGLRLQSIVQPSIEESAFSRKLLLPKIVDKIKQQPILGTGLGDTVTVYSPVFKKEVTTPHFDWGYLEILAEMGIFGLLAWLFLITSILSRLRINKPPSPAEAPYGWAKAGLAALLVINLTSPALFHVLGIIWLTYLLASLSQSSQNLSESVSQSV